MMTITNCRLVSCIGALLLGGTTFGEDILVDYNPGTGGFGGTWYNECCDHYYAEDVTFDDDTEITGLDIYTDYASSAGGDYQITIWEDDGFGQPGNMLQQWTQPGSGVTQEQHHNMTFYRHAADFSPVVFEANTTYWIGMTSVAGWHLGQSSIANPAPDDGLMAWFQGCCFYAFTNVGDMSFRLRGNSGGGDCLSMTVSDLIAGSRATWDVSGADPGAEVAIVYGMQPGSTEVNGTFGYCASFGIRGVSQNKVICRKSADSSGNVSCAKSIPPAARGLRVLSQAAQRGTCPDECVSNLDDQVVQ